jgi:3',5'-cyclic AMP phosphodiesterase CpdA
VTVIAHVSDLHLSPVPFPAEWPWRLKPVLGWINWRRQLGAHDDAVWEKTAAAVFATKPDFVTVTGDLIELGLSTEFMRARAALSSLGDPAGVSWAPGNHDAYTTDTTERSRPMLGDWLAPPRDAKADIRSHFPRLDRVGDAAVVTLCSGTPTWTFSAEGALGASQLARLDAMLVGLDRAACLPIIAIHHPPFAPGLSRLKRLRDGDTLLQLLARHRCPLVLHGHLHEACRREWRGGDHGVMLVGASSASATGRRGEEGPAFNLVTVAPDLSWSVETRPVA